MQTVISKNNHSVPQDITFATLWFWLGSLRVSCPAWQKLLFICSMLCNLSISSPAIKHASVCLIFISTHKLSLQYPLLSIQCHVTLRRALLQRFKVEAYFSIPLHLIEQRAQVPQQSVQVMEGARNLWNAVELFWDLKWELPISPHWWYIPQKKVSIMCLKTDGMNLVSGDPLPSVSNK